MAPRLLVGSCFAVPERPGQALACGRVAHRILERGDGLGLLRRHTVDVFETGGGEEGPEAEMEPWLNGKSSTPLTPVSPRGHFFLGIEPPSMGGGPPLICREAIKLGPFSVETEPEKT